MPDDMMRLDERPLHALAATLDVAPPTGEEFLFVPPLWHWLYFLPISRRRDLGTDGHVADRDGLASDVRERRMFAAARTEFHRPLRTGVMAQMTESTLGSRRVQGKSGPLRIVTLEYRYVQDGELCIREEREIVYIPVSVRGSTENPAQVSATVPLDSWSQQITPDAVMLFRFSALTFNSHRIHYDKAFAQTEEGHAERVVHGPLTAILLAELLRQKGIGINRFEFRARRPLFVDTPIQLQATEAEERITLRAIGADGATCMEASAWPRR